MPSIFRKPVHIDRSVYAMSMADGQNAEITMYGPSFSVPETTLQAWCPNRAPGWKSTARRPRISLSSTE